MDLPALVDSRRDIRLRPVREREGGIIAYRVILVAVLREIRAEYRTTVLPEYRAHRAYHADSAAWFEVLKARTAAIVQRAVASVARLFGVESSAHGSAFARSVRAGTGVTLPLNVLRANGREADLIRDYVERNASLITSLSNDAVKGVEQAVFEAKLANRSVADLSADIQHRFGVLRSRADLIAVDQMASLNADLTEARALEVGIDQYAWRAITGDGRTRALHLRINGNVYKFGEKTDAEGGLPPGRPVRCRCHAELIVPSKPVARRGSALAGFAAGLAAGIAAEALAGE